MKTQMFTRVLLAGACSFALVSPAFAQAADEGVEEGEIIVTAQNRAQDVSDVPIAINVVSGEQLAKAGFSDANDLSKIAPAVQINQDQGTVKITMRWRSDVDGTCRVTYRGQVYAVQYVLNPEEQNRELQLYCTTGVSDG